MTRAEYFKSRILTENQLASLRKGAANAKAAGVFLNPETRAKALSSLRATYASGNFKRRSHEEAVRIGKLARAKIDYQKTLAANRRLGKLREGTEMPPGPGAKGEGHWKSKIWKIRSPVGIAYECKNLSEFVRTHANLFDPEDLIWKKSKCRATHGIRSLFEKDGKSCSWHGWTAIASFEDKDQIARNILPT